MTPQEKAHFQLGRRAGVYASLDDMQDPNRFPYVERLLRDIDNPEQLKAELARMRRQFV
ncbi:hypothetical protein [Desulfoscipio gibsoniae]